MKVVKKLSAEERQSFIEHDRTMAATKDTARLFWQAAQAIKAGKLYREDYASWEDYCSRRHGMTPQNVNLKIAMGKTRERIKTEGAPSVLPDTYRQAQPLLGLPEDKRTEAWEEAVKAANGHAPTAAQVNSIVRQSLLDLPAATQKSYLDNQRRERARRTKRLEKLPEKANRASKIVGKIEAALKRGAPIGKEVAAGVKLLQAALNWWKGYRDKVMA